MLHFGDFYIVLLKRCDEMFQDRLKELLQIQGKSQKELAEFVGVKQNTVSAWINQGNSPKIEHIYRIVDFFSITFDSLFVGTPVCTVIDAKEIIKDKIPIDERNLLNMYRELDEKGKELVQNSTREIWADHRQPKCKSTTTENKNID